MAQQEEGPPGKLRPSVQAARGSQVELAGRGVHLQNHEGQRGQRGRFLRHP